MTRLSPGCYLLATLGGPSGPGPAYVARAMGIEHRNDPQSPGVDPNVERIQADLVESVEHSIAVTRALIETNRDLAKLPEHTATGEQRVIDGETELATLEAQLAALRRGDVDTAIKLHEAFPPPEPT
jgi:hypothetical protein